MEDLKRGGPAFPRAGTKFDWNDGSADIYQPDDGMSLRDYFAAKAMHAECVTAGALSGPAVALATAAEAAGQTVLERIAFNAYQVADAMLRAREAE